MADLVKGPLEMEAILAAAKELAVRYYKLTGRPLGVTGEVAEFEAVKLLGLELAAVRQSGWDATSRRADGSAEQLQVKGRWMVNGFKPGAKLGRIDVSKEFDAVLLVLLDAKLDATVIYRAERRAVLAALQRPGSKARNVRGQLSLATFKSIGRQVWPP